MKTPPKTIQLSKLRPKTVNYLEGFWIKLFSDIIKKVRPSRAFYQGFTDYRSLLGRFSFKLRWEHVVIAFLLGLLIMKSAPTHIIRDQIGGFSPAPAIASIKPLPLLKDSPMKPVAALDVVYVNKLRPPNTYGNTYDAGNCTYGVASRLPIPNNWGNANNWAYAASLAGYTVSNVPKEGSIAQTGGDSWAGHVAVVLSVNPDGSFVIWEENYNGLFSTDERTTTTAEFPNFIYIP